MDGVDLTFTDGALTAISRQAIKRKTGARGLRAILEQAMLDIMYEIPSQPNIREVVVSEEVIERREKPLVVYQEEKQAS
jgi:ATP-dependent Clp protease ATP-binding subunit ClpX